MPTPYEFLYKYTDNAREEELDDEELRYIYRFIKSNERVWHTSHFDDIELMVASFYEGISYKEKELCKDQD